MCQAQSLLHVAAMALRIVSGRWRNTLLAALGSGALASAACGAKEDSAGPAEGGAAEGSAAEGGTSNPASLACDDPHPWPNSADNSGGYVRCANDVVYRAALAACP